MASKLHIASVALALLGALALPAGALAQEDLPGLTQTEQETLGDNVEALEAGLYEVHVPGPNVITHGPDPQVRLDTRDSGGGIGFQAGDAERAPVCGSDYFQHFLYARTPGTADRLDTVRPQIQAIVRRMDAVLNQDAIESGGVSADYKVLCGGDYQPRVDGFTSPTGSFDDIVAAARANGFNAPIADYTIFFDGGGDCGVGSYIDDERLSASNASNQGGGYAVIYKGCWFSETPMHENAHAQGAVQYGSPYSTGSGGHCWDESDVMCYSPDGGDLHQGGIINRCTDRIHFDCGNDDYFDPKPEAGEYLASHWNLGSPLNRFIAFGPASPSQPPSTNPIGDLITSVTGAVSALVGGRRTGTGRGLAGAPGEWRYFKTKIRPSTERMTVTLNGPPSTDLDLYVRRGSKPTETLYICRSARDGASEVCRLRNPRIGSWFMGVRTAGGSGGVKFSVRSEQR